MAPRADPRTLLSRGPVIVAVGVLALAALVWAAAVPLPPHVIPRPTATGPVIQQGYDDTQVRLQGEADAPAFRPLQAHSVVDLVLGYTVLALFALAGLALAAFLLRALWRTWASRRRGVTADGSAASDLERLAAAVATDHEGRLLALAAGTPADGIVAAWEHLEATIRDAGVALPPSRTSTETTLDVLRRFPVDEEVLLDLAALYREASWSAHAMTEADRARAEGALQTLVAGLSRPRTPVRRG